MIIYNVKWCVFRGLTASFIVEMMTNESQALNLFNPMLFLKNPLVMELSI